MIGDDMRVFQVILHMVGSLLDGNSEGGTVVLRVFSENGSQERNDQKWAAWRHNSLDGDVHIRFEIRIDNNNTLSEGSSASEVQIGGRKYNSHRAEERLSFSICQKLVQMMHGNIWVVQNPQGSAQSMALVIRFQVRPSISITINESGESLDQPCSNSLFKGLQVLLADDVNRAVTRKLLEKLGCSVSTVSSGFDCLSSIGPASSPLAMYPECIRASCSMELEMMLVR
ncbi:hypothetical protein GQ457_03G029960 [Hibiscus cannabinus]